MAGLRRDIAVIAAFYAPELARARTRDVAPGLPQGLRRIGAWFVGAAPRDVCAPDGGVSA